MKIETCQFIPVTSIVPKQWGDWFYGTLSEGAPFTWGDNNRSLVSKSRFLQHVQDVLILGENDLTQEDFDEFIKTVESIDDEIYIDLEN